MTDLAKLVVKLEAQSAQLTTELERTRKRLNRFDRQVVETVKRVSRNVALVATAAAGALTLITRNAIDSADELSKMAQKIGVATDQLSRLTYAAGLAGVETASLQTAIVRLTRTVVVPTRESTAAFEALGVSVTDTSGQIKPTLKLVEDLADAFSGFADGPEKTAAAVALFGRAGADLIPLLNTGSAAIREAGDELQRLGGVVTPEAGRQAEQFNDNLSRLRQGAAGVGTLLAGRLLPSLVQVTDQFVAYVKDGDRVNQLTSQLAETAKGAAIGLATVGETLVGVARFMRAVGGSFQAVIADLNVIAQFLSRGGVTGLLSEQNRNELGAVLAERNRIVEQANQRYVDLWQYNGTAVSDALRNAFRGQRQLVGQSSTLLQGLIPSAAVGGGQDVQIPFRPGMGPSAAPPKPRLGFSLAGDSAGGATPKINAASAAMDHWNRVHELHLALAAEDAERQEALNAKVEQARAVYESTRSPLEQFNAQIQHLNELRDTFVNGRPLIDQQTYTRGVQQAQAALEAVSRGVEKVGQTAGDSFGQAEQFAIQAARNMQGAFADFLFDPFDRGLKGMLQDFEVTMRRMAAQAVAQQILGGIFSAGTGGLIDTVLGMGGGLGGDVPIRDSGGRGQPGQAYAIGTGAQPELFVPDRAGTFVPRDEWMGAGNTTININIPVSAPTGSVGRQTLDQIGSAALSGASRARGRNR